MKNYKIFILKLNLNKIKEHFLNAKKAIIDIIIIFYFLQILPIYVNVNFKFKNYSNILIKNNKKNKVIAIFK